MPLCLSAASIGAFSWFDAGSGQAKGRRAVKDLHDRIQKGSYRARPARRTYIPKPDGSKRPLSILCLEDKVVQQAVASRRTGRSALVQAGGVVGLAQMKCKTGLKRVLLDARSKRDA
jgi:hypothetical protein